MSRYGAEFLRDAGERLSVDGDAPDLSRRPSPYLYLVAGEDEVERLRAVQAARRDAGAPGTWFDRTMLARRFPWLMAADVDAALLGGFEEGSFDPEALLRALRRKAIALGASYRHARVVGLELAKGMVDAVRLDTGERLICGHVVNAAGPGAAAVAALAACEVPIAARRTTTFVFRTATPLCADPPIIVDRIQGLHVRQEGEGFLASMPNATDAAQGGAVDYDAFEIALWPALAHRVPTFEAIRFAGAWTGMIDASPFDGNPFIGPHPAVPNFLFLAGFNGHGLQHAPAAGRALAERIVHGDYRTIDLTRFGFARLAREPVSEYY